MVWRSLYLDERFDEFRFDSLVFVGDVPTVTQATVLVDDPEF
jgi:hypothetical protein